MRILVIGAGAIGCLLGGKLAQASNTVTLVGRSRFAEAVRQHGLRLTDEHGEHIIRNVRAVASLAEAYEEPGTFYDLAILSVKSYDTASAIAELAEAAPPDVLPTVLSMQNGVGNEEIIATQLGPDRIIAGTLTTPVSVYGPGYIRVDRPRYTLALSPWTTDTSPMLLDATHHSLDAAGFYISTYEHPRSLKWSKLLLNIMGNATSAILDQVPAEVLNNPRMVDVEISAWRETFAVMRAARMTPVNLGSYPLQPLAAIIPFLPNAALRRLLRRRVSRARGAKPPSLLLDLRSGKTRSEIDYLNGAVVQFGEELDVPTPVNRVLTETYRRLLAVPEERNTWRGQTDLLIQAVQNAQAARRQEPAPFRR